MDLADIVRQYRKDNNLSQRKFAQLCKISSGYVSVLENRCNPTTGEPVVPSVTVLNNIAEVIGISIDELLDKAEDMVVSLKPEEGTIISAADQLILDSYHNAPEEIRRAIDGLLEPYSPKKTKQRAI